MDSDQSTSLTWSQHIILQRNRRSSAITKCHGGVHYLDPGPSSPWYSISLGHCTSCWADNIIPACVCVCSAVQGSRWEQRQAIQSKVKVQKYTQHRLYPDISYMEYIRSFQRHQSWAIAFKVRPEMFFISNYLKMSDTVCVCVCITILVRTCFEKYFIFGEPLYLWGDFSGPSESDFFF